MTQLYPNTTYQSQAVALVAEIEKDWADGKIKTIEDFNERINNAIAFFNDHAGMPLVDYEKVVHGEPPQSKKMNRFWKRLQNDLNIVYDQLYFLKASAIRNHNFFKTEILRQQNLNAQAVNKVKTLQLYTTAHDASIIKFGDYFKNMDFVDTDKIPSAEIAEIASAGQLTLGRESLKILKSTEVTTKILPTSNGIVGNNQEIKDPSTAILDPVSNSFDYEFLAEEDRRSKPQYILDQKPDTWIEYEMYLVDEADRRRAHNFNFRYKDTSVEPEKFVNWAKGPSGGVLKLSMEFDLGSPRVINGFSYTPFGLEDNKNYSVRVRLLEVSPNGTDWSSVNPTNVWIGTQASLEVARLTKDAFLHTAHWIFEEKVIRYIRIHIEQPAALPANIGHPYYETKKKVKQIRTVVDGETVITEVVEGGNRVEGPIADIENPAKYYGPAYRTFGNLIQKTEAFVGKRWSIGIRDFTIEEAKYKTSSYIVSKPYRVDGVIDRVTIESDIVLPSVYEDGVWVKYYVSPDNGVTWCPISRIQDDYNDIPEVVVFNDPLPEDLQEPGAKYYIVNQTVNSLLVKIELLRPADEPYSTPIVQNYTLKIRKR